MNVAILTWDYHHVCWCWSCDWCNHFIFNHSVEFLFDYFMLCNRDFSWGLTTCLTSFFNPSVYSVARVPCPWKTSVKTLNTIVQHIGGWIWGVFSLRRYTGCELFCLQNITKGYPLVLYLFGKLVLFWEFWVLYYKFSAYLIQCNIDNVVFSK